MTGELRRRLEPAPPDIEHGARRDGLDYWLTPPDDGIGPRTGAILIIDGFGFGPEHAYSRLLRRYAANRYDCVAIGVDYFGCRLKRQPEPMVGESWHRRIADRFGVAVPADAAPEPRQRMRAALRLLRDAGVRHLPEDCAIVYGDGEQYQSFGLLPALDCLAVLGRVLTSHPLDRRRTYAFGSSYGGYLALLLAHYAPHSFALVVDNSGFVRARPELMLPGAGGGLLTRGEFDGVQLHGIEYSPWTLAGGGPHGFGPAQAAVRDLTDAAATVPTATRYCVFHGEGDTLVPPADKLKFVALRRRAAAVRFKLVRARDVDGTVFKTTEHGLKASLRHLLDLALAAPSERPDADDDFRRGSLRILGAAGATYRFAFRPDGGLTATLER